MKRYSVYLMDLETFNVYDDPIYTDDLEEAKQIAIDLVKHTNFDDNYEFMEDGFIVSIDDNNYEMTKDWQILSYGYLPYEEVTKIAGQHFNGYTQVEKDLYESILSGISKGLFKSLN